VARKILKILEVEGWVDKHAKKHYRTTALITGQDEATGYGSDFKVGQEVECWFNEEWDYLQMKAKK